MKPEVPTEPPELSNAVYEQLAGDRYHYQIWMALKCEACEFERPKVKVTYIRSRMGGETEWKVRPIYRERCPACEALQSAINHEYTARRLREKARAIIAKRSKR